MYSFLASRCIPHIAGRQREPGNLVLRRFPSSLPVDFWGYLSVECVMNLCLFVLCSILCVANVCPVYSCVYDESLVFKHCVLFF